MFTFGQLALLIIITEILLYGLLKDALATIRHCATARAYIKSATQLQSDGIMLSYDGFASAVHNKSNNKEENENGTNK